MKYEKQEPKKYCVIKRWKDGSETVVEYFKTKGEAKAWALLQPSNANYRFYLGEWD